MTIFSKLNVLLLVLTIVVPARAERHDGNWWRSLEKTSIEDADLRTEMARIVKTTYLVGFADGMDLGHLFTVLGSPSDKEEVRKQAFEAGGRSYQHHEDRHHMVTITNQQLADGLDSFYLDYRNRSILVYKAIFVVSLSIAGDPDKEADDIIKNLRQEAQ
jgi:hypothetical protein